jgi:Domain of unknown function (DUF4397)
VRVTTPRVVAVVLIAVLTAAGVGAAPAQAASVGYVRLAHLSPDTKPVDVYLSSLSAAVPEQVFPGVGYGVMSAYLTLPVGGYTIGMRWAGAPKTDPIILTTSVDVKAGKAYTVAGVGKFADIGLRVLSDDIALPTGNKSKVRIIQASVQMPVISVAVAGGPTIASNVAFATTTAYQLVSPGTWQLAIQPVGGGPHTDVAADLGSGNVYSLLVLDGANGLKAELRTDASRRGGLPNGGINTGGGGTSGPGIWPIVAILLTLTAVTVGAFVAMGRRRRRTVL